MSRVLALYLATSEPLFRDVGSAQLWLFACVVMLAVIAGNIRGIALVTVTALVTEARRLPTAPTPGPSPEGEGRRTPRSN